MFEHRLTEKLKSILKNNSDKVTVTKALTGFSKDFNIGTIKHNTIHFTEHDKFQIHQLLQIKGHDIHASPSPNMSRAEKLSIGPNEKAGQGTLKHNRISIKASYDLPLIINQKPIFLPPESHLDIDINAIKHVGHSCILLIENYENFNKLSETDLALPPDFYNPLAIYRGDKNESNLSAVIRFIELCDLPVITAIDIDPYGLVNVLKLKNFSGVMAPPIEHLNSLLKSPKTKRTDLYENHYLGCHSILDNLDFHHPCTYLWKVIKKHKAGVVQEQFIRLGLPLTLWSEASSIRLSMGPKLF